MTRDEIIERSIRCAALRVWRDDGNRLFDVDDFKQEGFLFVLQHQNKISSIDLERVGAYVYVACRNTFRRLIRRQIKTRLGESQYLVAASDSDDGAELEKDARRSFVVEYATTSTRKGVLSRIVNETLENYEPSEIGARLGRSYCSVYVSLRQFATRARRSLGLEA